MFIDVLEGRGGGPIHRVPLSKDRDVCLDYRGFALIISHGFVTGLLKLYFVIRATDSSFGLGICYRQLEIGAQRQTHNALGLGTLRACLVLSCLVLSRLGLGAVCTNI